MQIARFLIHGEFGPMLHFGFRARIVGGQLREGDEGRPYLASKSDLSVIAANQGGSRRVFDAYRPRPRVGERRPLDSGPGAAAALAASLC